MKSLNRSRFASIVWTALVLVLLAGAAVAQSPDQTPSGKPQASQNPPANPPEGEQWGGYLVHQEIEFGGRITDVTGSPDTYDTFVNQHSGPRLFQQTLNMQSQTQTGTLFDSLYLSSFGWGGDPSNAARLRMSKLKWYNFNATFRRDKNYFNYNLLANPLNPASTNPAYPTIQVPFSPHAFFTTRRMYNFDLTLLPQHWLSFRLGYNRNRNEGPSYSSYHQGTEALLSQGWNTTDNMFTAGVDVRVANQTTLSYTQTLDYSKQDTGYGLLPFAQFTLANGVPVSYGLPWLNSGSPCAAPLLAGGVANPVCNGFLSYTRNQRGRVTIPTEQATFRSSTLKWLDFIANVTYSGADMVDPLNEMFNGLETRTAIRAYNTNGTVASSRWVSVVAETGATIRLSDHARIVDTFRFQNFREPEMLAQMINYFFNASTVTTATLIQPIALPPGPLRHSTSSPADLVNDAYSRNFGQDMKTNEIQLQYDFSRFFGARLGYRFRRRTPHEVETSSVIGGANYPLFPNRNACLPLTAGVCEVGTGIFDQESDYVQINSHTLIAGVWFRPSEKLHVNAEAQISTFDNFQMRIDPRQQQIFRIDVNHNPYPWLSLGANLNIREERNSTQDINYRAHWRDVGFNATITPRESFGLDLAYNYTGALQSANVCYVGTLTAPGSTPCVNAPGYLETPGRYDNGTHYGMFALMFKPVPRLSANLGYSITADNGTTLFLYTLQPVGPMAMRWQQPLASLAFDVNKQVQFRAGWNYYQYGEDNGGFWGPTLPRYFHANNTTLSLRYAF
ncbi:MAG: hypothetical protein ACRD3E_05700 [Terriglobales bacterium]